MGKHYPIPHWNELKYVASRMKVKLYILCLMIYRLSMTYKNKMLLIEIF